MGKKLRFWCKIMTGRGGWRGGDIIYIDKEKPSILLVMLEMPLQYNKSESYHIYSRSG